MNRKPKAWLIFLLCLGLLIPFWMATVSLGARPPQAAIATQTSQASPELRGVWLSNVGSAVLFTPWGINRALHQLKQLNFNTIYPVVWNRGLTYYPSSVAKRETGNLQAPLLGVTRFGQDVLSQMEKLGHQQGLKVIPWFEYGFMAPANSDLAKRHPQWLTNRSDSTKLLNPNLDQAEASFKVVWLNPLHPEVQQFILNLIVEVVTKYDVDGIQLDDHFGLPVDFGYDSFTINLYQQEHGGKSPPLQPTSEWMRWRADKITNFMQRVYQAVKAVKPKCLVSLSPNPQYFAYKAYLQDWQTWVQRGLVDQLICQIYRDDLKTFLSELQQPALQMARRKIPVSIGIITGSWSRPVAIAQIQQQVELVRKQGFNGVSFFYWESLWGYIAPESPKQRRSVFQSLFS